MQFQAKLQEALLQFHQESLGIRAMLESYNEVICETHYDYVAVCPLLPPLLSPQIEHVVEIHVRQHRGSTAPLRTPLLHLRPRPILKHARRQPLTDQTYDALVSYPMFHERYCPFMHHRIEKAPNIRV